jgi:hypothetical protein
MMRLISGKVLGYVMMRLISGKVLGYVMMRLIGPENFFTSGALKCRGRGQWSLNWVNVGNRLLTKKSILQQLAAPHSFCPGHEWAHDLGPHKPNCT